MDIEESYDVLLEYCSQRGWVVEEPKTLQSEAEKDGVIRIGSLICHPLKLFSLLHEIGHLIILSNNYEEKYPGYQKKERHPHFQAALVEEEIKAWDAGFEVAKELGIEIDLKKWYAHRYDCIHNYIRLCRRPTRFEKIER